MRSRTRRRRRTSASRWNLCEELQAALDALTARRPDLSLVVRWVDAVPSTMDEVAAAAGSGARSGYVVIADRQTAGRGRFGRVWCSPPGAGLYCSCLWRPAHNPELVTLAAGVGVLEGVAEATGVRAHLKWPNDLLVGSRKLAGLLAEGAHIGTPDAQVIVGVGVNLEPAAYPPDVAARATSVGAELGRSVPRFHVFAGVLEHLIGALQALDRGEAGDILRRWRAASPSAIGTVVRWTDAGRSKEGVTAGLDDSGALLVRTTSRTERVIAGELHWDLERHEADRRADDR